MNPRIEYAEVLEKARSIKLLALDVDGVLTDGRLYFSSLGDEIKAFNSLDGQGIKLLQQYGIDVAIITARQSALVEARANNLGIRYLYQGQKDKLSAINKLMKTLEIDYPHIAYAGDDLPDLAVMRRVGLGIAVSNAHDSVKETAHWHTHKQGGEGAVREICDLILKAQGKYQQAIESFWGESFWGESFLGEPPFA